MSTFLFVVICFVLAKRWKLTPTGLINIVDIRKHNNVSMLSKY